MAEIVAKIPGSLISYMQGRGCQVVPMNDGAPCCALEDAQYELPPTQYQMVTWIAYAVDGVEIGAPRPKKRT